MRASPSFHQATFAILFFPMLLLVGIKLPDPMRFILQLRRSAIFLVSCFLSLDGIYIRR